MPASAPPRAAIYLLRLLSSRHRRCEMEADLLEGYAAWVRTRGPAAARRRVWREVAMIPVWRVLGAWRRAREGGVLPETVGSGGRGIRKSGGEGMMMGLMDDLRYAVRAILTRPAFTLGAIVMLALGIGVNTAVFSMNTGMARVADRFERPDELAFVWGVTRGWDRHGFSLPDYLELRGETPAFRAMGVYRPGTRYVSGGGDPERTGSVSTTPDLLPMLGLGVQRGRLYGPADVSPSASAVALLTHRFWVERYGGADDAVGGTIVLDDVPHTVIGVLSPEVEFETLWRGAGVFVPLRLDPADGDRSNPSLRIVGRLAEGSTLDEARAQTAGVVARLAEAHPEADEELRVRVEPFREFFYSSNDKLAMVGLLLAVCAVLLIACVNLANLLLAKAVTRQGEVAIRLAMGATPGRLVRQLLSESLILSLVGGALGVILGLWGMDLLLHHLQGAPFLAEEVGLDGRLLTYTLVVSTASGLAFGLAPALMATRMPLGEAMKESGAAGSSSRRRRRFRDAVLVAQLALTVPLVLTCAVSFVNVRTLERVDLGFPSEGLLSARVDLPAHRYGEAEQRSRFQQDALRAVRALAGVVRAGVGLRVPIGPGSGGVYGPMVAEGREGAQGSARGPGGYHPVSDGYFATLGAPILAGRAFTPADGPGSEPVAVVNEALAERYWPGEDPVGRRLRPETDPERLFPGVQSTLTEPVTVVGVVADFGAGFHGEPPTPELFVPQFQQPSPGITLVARTEGDLAAVVAGIRAAIRRVDPTVPVSGFRTGDMMMDDWLRESRVTGVALGLLAVLALGLSIIGLYGMVSHSVTQRTFELGVRIVLGANPRAIRFTVTRAFLVLGGLGLTLGIAASVVLGMVARSFLVLLPVPYVPTVMAIAALLMGVVALAAYVPALRTTHIQPAVALRSE